MKHIEYFDPAPYIAEPDNLKEVVDSQKVAIVDLGKELNPETLYSLAEMLGPVMEEPRLPTRKKAYRGSVVRLESVDIPGTTSNGKVECMGMHVDHATSPSLEQPSYVLLGSLVPPERNNGGDTAVIPMSYVFENLTADEIQLLRESRQHFATAYYTSESSANLVSTSRKGAEYISIWDGEPWSLISPEGKSSRQKEKTVFNLRELIYDKQSVQKVPWEPGRVAVLRNDMMLHGRTAQVEQKKRVMLRVKSY